jgi:hypothetical protein
MIIVITDDAGESVYADIAVASFDAKTKRVTFVIGYGTEQARSLTVVKGRVQAIEGGSLVADWHPDGEEVSSVQ